MQRLAVALHVRLQRKLVAGDQDRHSMFAQRAADDNHVARFRAGRRQSKAGPDHANTACIDEQLVGGSPLHHLGITCYDRYASSIRHAAHAACDAA
jgi:hypothetical protein